MSIFHEFLTQLSCRVVAVQRSHVINSPRAAIKQAFQSQLITAGHEWISALDDRNLTTHTYNEEIAELVERKIRQDYYPLLLSLRQTFVQKTGV
jgi:nucleotidyltransferase substrate binding protein (TIGR01987 family)